MSAGKLIILHIGILLALPIEQVLTTLCDESKGDCVADDKRNGQSCKGTCFRIPESCKGLFGVDLFGKEQKYQCHCKHLRDCKFRILSECENGCLPGYKAPYCQKRKYHEFIKNDLTEYSYLFSSDNKKVVKPEMKIQFRNTYRFNTVEVYSDDNDATIDVTHPIGMECEQESEENNMTICTGDVIARFLNIKGKAGVYHIKLYGCPPELYGENCTKECHCTRRESCHQITGICENGCEDGWYGKKCDTQTYDNVAKGKETKQHSVGSRKVFANGKCMHLSTDLGPDKAVDGNFDPAIQHNSCVQTDHVWNPSWQVALNKTYKISQLRIYNQIDKPFDLKGIEVYLNSKRCFESKYHEYKQVIHIKCEEPMDASIVTISLESVVQVLTLCEVEILQCKRGFYGDMCMESCELCVGSMCNQFTGCEKGCVEGYYWDKYFVKCKECPSGTFGKNCEKLCRCPQTCEHNSESCPVKCQRDGYGFNCPEEETKRTKGLPLFLIVPLLLLLVAIILVMAAVLFRRRKKTPVDVKYSRGIRKLSGNIYSEGICDDTARLTGEIPLEEIETAYSTVACSSFKLNLLKYVARKKHEAEPFNKEFLDLQKPSSLSYKEAIKPENAKKNHYKTIFPYDHSRVKLQPDEISASDYINANFICDKRYIACQGPTQSTVIDFWRMIWQLKCRTIVQLRDVNASGKKCMQYWPDEENTEAFGTIQVKHIDTTCHTTYIHRRFVISKAGVYYDGRWTIEQFFFKNWPVHDIPQHPEYILEFRNALQNSEGIAYPLVVHCSAGVGRTGAYICIDVLLEEMLSGKDVDVLACITKLRQDRMGIVQKRIQLEFVYDVLVENILTGDYDIDVSEISNEFSRIRKMDISGRMSILEHQFLDIIKQVRLRNVRFPLKDELENFNINGVFIDGPSSENEFLVTETPLDCKSVNFLKFISENCYLNIVSLLNSTRDIPNYLPRKLNESVKIGPYLIKLIGFEDKKICLQSVLKVRFNNKRKSRIEEYQINHFLVTLWMKECYPSCSNVLKLCNLLRSHLEKQVDNKITVHSSGDFKRSGLLCLIQILKDAITSQSVVNIVRLVRLIRKIHPDIVPDFESYAYIWEVAEYLQKESSLYSNFVL